MRPEIKVASSPNTMYRMAAAEFVLASNAAVRQKDSFAVSLSGGSTPRALYSLLATDQEFRARIPWGKCCFFWGDERQVPPDHAESCFRMAREAMLQRVPVKASQIFRISGERSDPSEAAREYEQVLSAYFKLRKGEFPRFDLTLLGRGPDGHTASLFPDTTALDETDRVVVENWVGKFFTHRITLTSPAFNNSARVIFLVAGEDKALALRGVLGGPFVPQQLPVQLIRPNCGSVLWLVDEKAASFLRTMAFQELS